MKPITLNSSIEINGIHIPVLVRINVEIDDIMLEEVDNRKYIQRFESSELENLCILVTAFAEGEEGSDSLGGCHVNSNDMLNDIQDIVKDHGMLENALTELKNNIIAQATRLKRFVK